ncbi:MULTISPECIES: pyridoxal 5'-phosphate synthase glutaminase subunit PdxT [Lawsonella]|jgi:pyridoxal 5'-phosphate synthase, glutaminase subunit pdx2|uniref:Pyridoxal 5'-phosphate synthase subunit PdxT n=1 Tax=Lawsonella clevelandensis TaxID=1528099 RepID=A0A2W5K534_9ACTN|nr:MULTISPECIES: pyridoxal 5'-phosphate synthase glutaminase subunit PdxT [Lawsonella]PZP89896.1 MAG: pyridoxal 5'-phosphate synthase glutaminase subunit PdxT [Lawsonella clevelandensis]GHT86253.1 pyridoxal 5'-phosphate synthase subunit PdxT [Actinomycetota bacterium]
MSAPLIGVLDIQGAVTEHIDAFQACGATTQRVRRPSDLHSLDGLVIPGGESTTLSKLLTVCDMWEPIADLLREGLPVYGSCAGMILLAKEVLDTRQDARCFGAMDTTVRRNAFGRQVDSFEADLTITPLGMKPFRGVFIRAPWVEKVGKAVDILCTVTDTHGNTNPVAVRQGNALATSFHPELVTDLRMHQYFLSIVQGTM